MRDNSKNNRLNALPSEDFALLIYLNGILSRINVNSLSAKLKLQENPVRKQMSKLFTFRKYSVRNVTNIVNWERSMIKANYKVENLKIMFPDY